MTKITQHSTIKPIVSVIGVGYVGLPLAVALSSRYQVIAYDIDSSRISSLQSGIDVTNEICTERLLGCENLRFSDSLHDIRNCNVYIITVPTPVTASNTPNLNPLINATKAVGSCLSKGNIVIYESTVYPGATEEVCVPLLEDCSGLTYNSDFFCGYSPERINPSDTEHTIDNVIKIVSGSTPDALDTIDSLYRSIVQAGTFRASSIKVAEAAKVIENSQRDLNIAFINELSLIFSRLGVDTDEVLKAASTKWNFIKLSPGLVGGHCISVDPYYLAYKAEMVGYHPELLLAGRRINDGMASYIVSTLFKTMSQQDHCIASCTIGILGLTFKNDCPDIRNSKVFDIVRLIHEWGASTLVTDPLADAASVYQDHGLRLVELNDTFKVDSLIVCVQHSVYQSLTPADLIKFTKSTRPILFDVKSIYSKESVESAGFTALRL